MGAVHGVVLKYVGLTAVSGLGLAVSQETSSMRLPLTVVMLTNMVIVVLFTLDRGTFLLGKNPKTGRVPLPFYVAWCGFVVPTWLYTKIHTVYGKTFHDIPEAIETMQNAAVDVCQHILITELYLTSNGLTDIAGGETSLSF